jgi:hypothetical protein
MARGKIAGVGERNPRVIYEPAAKHRRVKNEDTEGYNDEEE